LHRVPAASADSTWAREVQQWCVTHAPGLLARDRTLLEPCIAAGDRPDELGLLGLTGVGKSSLLNAVIAPGPQVLPAGGVGPLTGAAVRVRPAHDRTLTVHYRDQGWLFDAITTLRGGRALDGDLAGRLSLVCTGDQYAARDPGWLLAALEHAFQPASHPAPAPRPDVHPVLDQLHAALQRTSTSATWSAANDEPELHRKIRLHTVGQFAPLCETIELAWPPCSAWTLPTIVDLPGLGALHDAHAGQTLDWLGQSAMAILVVDRAGIPEIVVTALQRSGFLARLRAGRAQLAIAITKLDLVADDQRRAAPGQRWSTHYFTACQQAIVQMRAQLATLLGPGGRGPDDDARRLTAQIRIIPVSSRERHRIQRENEIEIEIEDEDEIDRPRLKSPASTGIPELQRTMCAMARLQLPLARAIDIALRAAPLDDRRDHGDLWSDWTALLEQEG
jgi:hypothetical protein